MMTDTTHTTPTTLPAPAPNAAAAENPLLAGRTAQRIKAARNMVHALCQPRNTEGSREWVMSIPARPDYDPDLVIGAALSDAKALLTAYEKVTAQRDALLAACNAESKAEKHRGMCILCDADGPCDEGNYLDIVAVDLRRAAIALCAPAPATSDTLPADTSEPQPPDWSAYEAYRAATPFALEYIEWREETGNPLPDCLETGENANNGPCDDPACECCNPAWLRSAETDTDIEAGGDTVTLDGGPMEAGE